VSFLSIYGVVCKPKKKFKKTAYRPWRILEAEKNDPLESSPLYIREEKNSPERPLFSLEEEKKLGSMHF
jgi:hypothetical protein